MGFQKPNARVVTQRLKKNHRAPAASSTLSSLAHQVERNPTSQPTRSPHVPQAPVIQPSRAGTPCEVREEQLITSFQRAGETSQELSNQLPDRSSTASRRNLRNLDPKEWGEEEDQIVILNHKAGKTWKEISELLSGRTPSAATSRFENYLNDGPPTYVEFTQREDEIIRRNYDAGKTWKEICELMPHRTKASMKSRRNYLRLGTPRQKRNTLWSPLEERLLVSLRTRRKTWDKITKLLPGRSKRACRHHYAFVLNRDGGQQELPKAWTKSEDDHLRTLVESMGAQFFEIAKRFPGRTERACDNRYYKIATFTKRRNGPWTASEEETLLSLVIAIGTRWTRIAKEIPTRSKNALPTHYYEYKARHDGKIPEACGPSPEEWRQKWESESTIHDSHNELSRTTLMTFNVPDDEAAETNPTQEDFTTQATNEAVDAEAVDAEAVDAEPVDSEAVDSEAVDSESVDSESVDSESVEPEATEYSYPEPTLTKSWNPRSGNARKR